MRLENSSAPACPLCRARRACLFVAQSSCAGRSAPWNGPGPGRVWPPAGDSHRFGARPKRRPLLLFQAAANQLRQPAAPSSEWQRRTIEHKRVAQSTRAIGLESARRINQAADVLARLLLADSGHISRPERKRPSASASFEAADWPTGWRARARATASSDFLMFRALGLILLASQAPAGRLIWGA